MMGRLIKSKSLVLRTVIRGSGLKVLLCCLPALVCFLLQPLSACGFEVHFRKEAVVDGGMLRLGDIAEVISDRQAGEIEDIRLFPAPGPGERQCYSGSTVRAYVLEAFQGRGEEISWTGPDRVCVRHKGVLLEPGKVVSVINSKLSSALSHLSAEKTRFVPRNKPDTLALPPGSPEYQVEFSDPDILNSRKASVIVRVDGRVVKNLTVPGRVEAYMPVVAAREKLRRGTVISRHQVETRVENIADLRSPCLDAGKVEGKRVKRSIAAGEVLSRSDIELPVLVERRQMVTMILEKGPLHIRARGRAASRGRMGDLITVENMRSNKEVQCRVIGKGVTRVEF